MILIALVGLAFVFGMPYLLDSSTYPPQSSTFPHPQTPTQALFIGVPLTPLPPPNPSSCKDTKAIKRGD